MKFVQSLKSSKNQKLVLAVAILLVISSLTVALTASNKSRDNASQTEEAIVEQKEGDGEPFYMNIPAENTEKPQDALTPSEVVKEGQKHFNKEITVFGTIYKDEKGQLFMSYYEKDKDMVSIFIEDPQKVITDEFITDTSSPDAQAKKPATIKGTFTNISLHDQQGVGIKVSSVSN